MKLVEDVRPILRSIQRIAALPQHFDPATSERTFRVEVSDFTPSVLPEVMARVQKQAPGVAVEWSTPGLHSPMAIADGHVDVAPLSSATNVPEGVVRQDAGELRLRTYLRKDHPAIASWGLAEWGRWPHIQVMLGDRQRTTLDSAISESRLQRTIGARVPHFSCVPDLLARTDMLATLPLLLPEELLERSNLCVLEPPMPIAPVPLSYFWSFRLTNDPGGRWIRTSETTGIADPGPIIQTFLAETAILTRFHLDGVVTGIDAVHGLAQLGQVENRAQVAHADRMLLTKCDLAEPAVQATLSERLAEMNSHAQLLPVDLHRNDLREVLSLLFDACAYTFDTCHPTSWPACARAPVCYSQRGRRACAR